ncbi:MAG: hypothetical protein ABI165_08620, partial [Bryobacteraceae bacterium]
LIERVRGVRVKDATGAAGYTYQMPGALSPQQVRDLIPKDILIFNWFWQDVRAKDGRGEPNDIEIQEFGFHQIFNNFTPAIEHWQRRSRRPGVLGGAPSAWAATNEFTFGKDLMHDYLGCINLMWSTHWTTEQELSKIVQSLMPDVRRRLSGRALPSEDGDPVIPVDISSAFEHAYLADMPGVNLDVLKAGAVQSGTLKFQVRPDAVVVVGTEGAERNPLPRESKPIPIGQDVSSIIFLQASAKPAANDMSYRYIHNFPDTADLLGWYEVVYEDDFVETVPIRFGVNILPWTWGAESDVIAKGVNPTSLDYAYAADAVKCGDFNGHPVTFFAFEWVNPRFGKRVKEIRLHGSAGFTNVKGKKTPSNAIVLAAVSVVKKRID